jgi:hypothetical protein
MWDPSTASSAGRSTPHFLEPFPGSGIHKGVHRHRYLFALALLTLPPAIAHAQTPQQIIQQVTDTERAENKTDHSQWIYLDHSVKPKEQLVRWVATTAHGDVGRVLVKDGRELSEPEQQNLIQKYLDDPHAQNKQIAENAHDLQQVDDFLKLLPTGFLWTITHAGPTDTTLHFVPDPKFHPPTREARVICAMTGDLVADNQQHRIRSMSGHLIHDVTFGGGLLGRLKEGSSFSLDQQQVGPSVWQLTAIRVHLQGNALLFKSVSLQQDDERSRFTPAQSSSLTLDQAATAVMLQPGNAQPERTAEAK